MRGIGKLYRLFNVLSLDVVAGSLVSAIFFARILSVEISLWGFMSLGFSVWIIYTADHLWDAKNIPHPAATPRHRFHQRHFTVLVKLVAVAALLDVVFIYLLRRQVFEWGLVLGIVVSFYVGLHRSLKFPKEILISVLYTSGVLLPSIALTDVELSFLHYMLFVQFGVVALINLLMFSWFDREPDKRDNQRSYVTMVGDRSARMTIWILMGIEVLLIFIQMSSDLLLIPSLIIGFMGIILFVIFYFRSIFGRNDYYRLIGDGIFLVPFIFLL